MDSGRGYLFGTNEEFNIVEFVKRPIVLLRITGWVFSIVVFACISRNVNFYKRCPYASQDACGYSSAVGIIAFIALLIFLVCDAMLDRVSNMEIRRYLGVIEITFSGIWSFFWFVCFCFLADSWRRQQNKTNLSISDAEAPIAFSFFSIFVFAGLTALCVIRYRRESMDDLLPNNEPQIFGNQTRYQDIEGFSGPTPPPGYIPPNPSRQEYYQSPFAPPSIPRQGTGAPST